jgi:hypothetical protein
MEGETIKELEEKIATLVEDDKIVVMPVTIRSSTSFYNYKTRYMFIVFKPAHMYDVSYEDALERDVVVRGITVGAFQELDEFDVLKVMKSLKKRGYTVRKVTIW